jgi:hypothetical protein
LTFKRPLFSNRFVFKSCEINSKYRVKDIVMVIDYYYLDPFWIDFCWTIFLLTFIVKVLTQEYLFFCIVFHLFWICNPITAMLHILGDRVLQYRILIRRGTTTTSCNNGHGTKHFYSFLCFSQEIFRWLNNNIIIFIQLFWKVFLFQSLIELEKFIEFSVAFVEFTTYLLK